MQVDIDPMWAMAVFFTSLRLSVLLVMTPIFSSLSGLVTVRVLFTLAMSMVLVTGLETRTTLVLEPGPVLLAAVAELVLGAVLVFGVFAAFGAFSVAGKILDIQSGFGIGMVYDPVTRAGAPLFASMLNLLAVVVFFGMNGHHAFLRGIAFSVTRFAPGSGFTHLPLDEVLRQFGLMFSLGVALIVPVMFALLLIEVALAVVSRVLPQMNVFVVGVPVKLVAGLAVFGLTVGTMGPGMARVYGTIFLFWQEVLRHG